MHFRQTLLQHGRKVSDSLSFGVAPSAMAIDRRECAMIQRKIAQRQAVTVTVGSSDRHQLNLADESTKRSFLAGIPAFRILTSISLLLS